MSFWCVWSRGLETWEPARLTAGEIAALAYSHTKTVNGEKTMIFVDSLGRFFGMFCQLPPVADAK